MRDKLTVIVPCKNESGNIRECIASFVDLADEILIADSGSTDGTMELARAFCDCRIVERDYRNSGDFKNWAIPQAAHEWVLLLDADERITRKLAAEIERILASEDQRDGYWIYRLNHFLGHPIHFGGYRSDCVTRLFRRDISRYDGPSDHGEVAVQGGNVGKLKNRMLHYSFWSYDQFFAKFHRYTTLQAQQWNDTGRRTNALQLLTRPVTRFVRDYFIKLGFMDGLVGLQLAGMAAFYTFTKQARLWEQYRTLDRDAVEQSYRNVIAGSQYLPAWNTSEQNASERNISEAEHKRQSLEETQPAAHLAIYRRAA